MHSIIEIKLVISAPKVLFILITALTSFSQNFIIIAYRDKLQYHNRRQSKQAIKKSTEIYMCIHFTTIIITQKSHEINIFRIYYKDANKLYLRHFVQKNKHKSHFLCICNNFQPDFFCNAPLEFPRENAFGSYCHFSKMLPRQQRSLASSLTTAAQALSHNPPSAEMGSW